MEEFDVVIVGAGISGINTAYRVQTELPSSRYVILDAREDIGGTWSFFRYPGIRSDSDLYSFGFAWKPWTAGKAIAAAPLIMNYLREAVSETGIDQHIRFKHRVSAADWSIKEQCWQISVTDTDGSPIQFKSKFIVLGTGYYDYEKGLSASIPGIDNFGGPVVHPQFWPEDFDYSDKNIVLIGSGATAVTLLPNLAKKAAYVTMLQRSPTYIVKVDNKKSSSWGILPQHLSLQLTRLFHITIGILFYNFCRLFPSRARNLLQSGVAKQLPTTVPMDPHFTPTYRPWDQRVCFTPDGDFFEAIKEGKANVATGTIREVVEDGVILQSGEKLDADALVTATGLKIQAMGGICISVDGEKIDIGEKYAWNNAMIQDIPNFFFVVGYINASWTLGADATAKLFCRLVKYMQRQGYQSAVAGGVDAKTIGYRPLLGLTSTYVTRGGSELPKCGNSGPWLPRTNYFFDLYKAVMGNITTGLAFS
ncbi:hypothetical protein N7532_000444 [Penicillium argentinense]|uniref:Uncharacterized protein n=1 Tax=Penicillium argentinense TaxID=1131581 RepID=A0A9W9G5J2_9EURO|nr:uncharacterized protein N7532_000444 [Penicillium argentinense]KAJ5112399.1 hypothetical protein N7532_000444 [Penicillium argentinense]